MELVRAILFVGLVFHKALWEILKRKGGGDRAGFGRSFRSVVKCGKGIVLAFLAVQTLFLDLFPISAKPTALKIIGTSLFFLGLTTAVIGRLHLGKNWADLEDYQVLAEQSLVTTGIYRYIRHPIYSGDILLLIGLELALNSWLVLLVFVPAVIIVRQALAEEALLSNVFPDYYSYRKGTKRFIPYVL